MTQAACWCPQFSGHTVVMAQAGSGLESVHQHKLVDYVFPTYANSVTTIHCTQPPWDLAKDAFS